MNGTQRVVAAFAAVGLLMILLPVALFTLAANSRVPPEKGLDGAISRLFLAAEKSSRSLDQTVPNIERALGNGMTEEAAARVLAASDFQCRSAPNALSCRRGHGGMSCDEDWFVDVFFGEHDAISTALGRRKATCL